MIWKLNVSALKLESCLFGLTFLVLGGLLICMGEEVWLQCTRLNNFQNRCQLVSYKLIGSKVLEEFSNIEGAVLEQAIYEPRPGRKSIVDSRISLIVQKQRISLNDDHTSRLDQGVVEQINLFISHQNQQFMQVFITQYLHFAYIGILLILFGSFVIKQSIKLTIIRL